MNPQVEKVILQAINEVHRKSVHEAKLKGIEEGIKKGRNIGIEEGRDIGIEEVAGNLKDVMSDEEISRITGLSVERVKSL